MSRIRMRFRPNEQGQSIVILALFFLFAFLVFAALSVDGTMIYLRRRQLQNMADAAALAAAEQLSQNKDVDVAYQVAMESIEENKGRVEWYFRSDPPYPPYPNPPVTNVGSGLDLSMGIEITNACDVRVALLWSDMGTYFTQFFGRQTLQVGARAHTSCSKVGGLQPIAVKRFGDERDWDVNLTNVNDATVYCDECSTHKSLLEQGLHKANDFLQPEGLDVISEWPGFPNDTDSMYDSPVPFADLALGAPGREYFFLGSGVTPNVGTTSYAGLVNLDIRHVSSPPLEYYNGVEAGTQSNVLKDLGEYYIRRGYCGEIPVPGDQVAVYNGGSTAFAAHAFQDIYRVGDVVAVIVYNGHVFSSPSLAMTGSPDYQATHPTTQTVTSNVLTYSIHLEAENGFQSAAGGLTMNVEGLDGFAEWGFSPTSPVLGRNGINERTLTLHVTPTLTISEPTHVVTGTRTFYVSAIDDKLGGTGIRRYWAGVATIGDEVNYDQRDLPAVTCTPTNSDQNYPFLTVVKGQQARYELQLDLWGVASEQDVTVSAGSLETGFEWVTAPDWTRRPDPSKHPGAKLRINLKVNDAAVPRMEPYVIPLTVSATGMDSQPCDLYVIVEEAQTTVKEYVEILGYAALEVTGYYNSTNLIDPDDPNSSPANAVRGRIVSELMYDPSDLEYGSRARLIPWEWDEP
jgi:hypothetical protein